MKSDRWDQIQRIFESTLTLAPGSRTSYLERVCGGDRNLLREVESLIAAGASAQGFLRGVVGDAAGDVSVEREFTGSDRFIVQRRLGSGGFGIVYQVYDRHREAILALKTLPLAEAAALYQFKREFRELANLSHPNLVTLHELMAEDGRWFFTMELITGVDFLRYARSCGDDFNRLRESLQQLAGGVCALHQFGKLHCDLKPHNVLVDSGGHVSILDFGLVKNAWEEDRDGAVFGTLKYMAPEQGRRRVISPASDWYSIGVMLYEALTDSLPFPGIRSSILRQKQGLEPELASGLRPNAPADLCDLAAALLQSDPLLRPTGVQVLRRLGMSAEASTQAASLTRSPLVGREQELESLREALRHARQGRLTTILLHGPSGVGKSALSRAFLDEVRELKTHLVLEGRCCERESVPYKALDGLVDNLKRWLLGLSHSERKALLPVDFAALARLFPVLMDLVEQHEVVEIPNAAELRLRGFKGLRDILARLAARQPLVVSIDDLQWGDMDSAAILLDLLGDPHPLPMLLLACYRSDEVDSSPLLRELLRARSTGVSGSWMDLPVQDLGPEAARDLALSLSNRQQPVSISLAAQIADESRGNPFFIGELLKHAQSDPDPEAQTGTMTGQSFQGGEVSLDDLVRRRVAALPDACRGLLEVIAIAAQPIEPAIAGTAAQLGTGAYLELAQLRRHHLIRTRVTEATEEIETYHDRIRQATERSLSPERLKECHYRLATASESAAATDPRFLAIHFGAAGVAHEAFRYSLRAAGEAAATLAFDNAARFYRLALEFAPEDSAKRISLQSQLGDALCNAGRGAEGAQVYLSVAQHLAGAERLELRRRAAAQFLMAGRIDEGLELTRDALKVVGMSVSRRPWQAMLSFFVNRLWLRTHGLKFRERQPSEISAEDLLRIDICASLVRGLAMVDPIRAHPFHARLLSLALRSGEPQRASTALCSEAAYFALQGGRKKEKVERLLANAQDLADRSRSQNAVALVALAKGMSAFLQGQWKEAVKRMTLAESILRERCTGVAWEVATAHMMGSVSLFLMGEVKELKYRLPRIIQDAETRGDLFEATDLRTRLAHAVCLAEDQPERAYLEIRAAVAQWRRQQFDLQHWWAWIGSVETDLYVGHPQDAWRRIEADWRKLQWSLLTRVQYVRLESLHHRARAALALVAAGSTGAQLRRKLLRSTERDTRAMERHGMPWSNALAALLRAGIAFNRGKHHESVNLLESAERQLLAADMALYSASARRTRGRLIGGEFGRELSASADEWMRNQEIRNPERMAGMLAPGF